MRHLLSILAALTLCSAAYGQTMKSLMFNATNGQVVANTGTNALTFTNDVEVNQIIADEAKFGGTFFSEYQLDASAYAFTFNWEESYFSRGGTIAFRWFYDGATGFFLEAPLSFIGTNAAASAAATRTNLGLGWSALTNSNAATFRTAAGLGQTDTVTLQKLMLNGTTSALFPFSIGQKQTQGTNEKFYGLSWDGQYSGDLTYHHDVASISSEPEIRISSTAITVYSPITFASGSPQTRTNLGLGGGITTNISFVVGTNTNSVTISNGIITGWTQ